MSKERIAQVGAVAILLAALGVAVARRTGRAEQNPQDAIYTMLVAARAGDVNSYLAAFTAPMEASLRQTAGPGFAKYLRDFNASLKGVAVSDPQKITDQQVKIRVEYVYQDRNDAQVMYLDKTPQGWKISRMDADERVKTLVPYGTPVK